MTAKKHSSRFDGPSPSRGLGGLVRDITDLVYCMLLVMLAPYCMIHYYKPFPEALGAIGAGLVLGVLAWRTETIIYGWFLHYAVALSMDLLALWQAGRL
ncbi:MAG: hypothetical protein MUC57_09435 [Desulfobacterales bacterium]|nr:hypothetical protein [Desulfobacterales bacterium]